jgi:hypothetical protein
MVGIFSSKSKETMLLLYHFSFMFSTLS